MPSSRSGYTLTNKATFVIGPEETIVTSGPWPLFQVVDTALAMPSRARIGVPSPSRRASTAELVAGGRPWTPPRPSIPWISGSCRSTRMSGFFAPG